MFEMVTIVISFDRHMDVDTSGKAFKLDILADENTVLFKTRAVFCFSCLLK